MQKARFIIAMAVFLTIAIALPFLANLLPDHTRTLSNAAEIMSKTYIHRVVNYVTSGKKADVVVAGSSLVIFPHMLTDGYYEKVPVPFHDPIQYADFFADYVEMAHLKKLYAQASGDGSCTSSMSIVDLGVPSLMLTDCQLLFEKLQNNDVLPRTVILLLAPRDFMDNTVAPERNLFKYEIEGRVTLKDLSNSKDANAFFSNLLNAMKHGANTWSSQFRSGGQRVFLAVKKMGKKPVRPDASALPNFESARHFFYFGNGKLPDLESYKPRYNPVDHKRIQEQLQAMDKLLEYLKKRSVKIIVVNMPLTEENRALIEKDALDEIQQGMKSACSRAKIRFIDLPGIGSWNHGDFSDSVHLNAEGGHRLFSKLSEVLSAKN